MSWLLTVVSSELHSSDRGKRTSDQARTQDLRSIAEFQPREPLILVKNFLPKRNTHSQPGGFLTKAELLGYTVLGYQPENVGKYADVSTVMHGLLPGEDIT